MQDECTLLSCYKRGPNAGQGEALANLKYTDRKVAEFKKLEDLREVAKPEGAARDNERLLTQKDEEEDDESPPKPLQQPSSDPAMSSVAPTRVRVAASAASSVALTAPSSCVSSVSCAASPSPKQLEGTACDDERLMAQKDKEENDESPPKPLQQPSSDPALSSTDQTRVLRVAASVALAASSNCVSSASHAASQSPTNKSVVQLSVAEKRMLMHALPLLDEPRMGQLDPVTTFTGMVFPQPMVLEKEANDLESQLVSQQGLDQPHHAIYHSIYQKGRQLASEQSVHDFQMPRYLQQWLSEQDLMEEANNLEDALKFFNQGALNEDDCDQLQVVHQRAKDVASALTECRREMPCYLHQPIQPPSHVLPMQSALAPVFKNLM